MRQVFENVTPMPIDAGSPSDVSSRIEVSGVQGTIRHLSVTLDVDHTFTNDLEISLQGANGQRALLVGREGGSGDNFRATTFDDRSTSSVTNASPPFRGSFRPEEKLATFNDLDPNGTWILRVADRAFLDGGSLNRWSLSFTVEDAITSAFTIQVRFLGGLTTSQESVFESAAARWSEIIVGDIPSVDTDIGVVDDIVIDAQGTSIDGVSGILGQAGPTAVRFGSSLPARGIMSFDSADFARMEADGSLVRVIIHEMGHVLGIGTIWRRLGLLQGAGTTNPIFTGRNAMREFADLLGTSISTAVPVANTGGPGTRGGHWRESVFGHELMTGFLDVGVNPISRLTIAALKDMGYQVNFNAADPYILPSALELALMGIDAETHHCQERCRIYSPSPVVLPKEEE